MTEIPTYDVFISHAFEDKDSFTDELARELTRSGLKVWYSGFQLKLGDSIAGSINKALKGAAFGIVVISPIYLKKRWAMNELNALFAQETDQNTILPILHNITVDEIKEHVPILADRYTISSEAGMGVITKKVLQAMSTGNRVHSDSPPPKTEKRSQPKDQGNRSQSVNYSNVSKNSNSVTATTGNGKIIILIIFLIICGLLAVYKLTENTHGDPPSIKNNNPVQPNNISLIVRPYENHTYTFHFSCRTT